MNSAACRLRHMLLDVMNEDATGQGGPVRAPKSFLVSRIFLGARWCLLNNRCMLRKHHACTELTARSCTLDILKGDIWGHMIKVFFIVFHNTGAIFEHQQ
jgi:hypothetical protein